MHKCLIYRHVQYLKIRCILTVSSSSVASSPSPIFLTSVCSNSYDGSPMNLPLHTLACLIITSVAGGRRPQCTQSLLKLKQIIKYWA